MSKINVSNEYLISRYWELNSCEKLAKELNVSKSLIVYTLKKINIDISKNIRSIRRLNISEDEIVNLYLNGKSINDIAKIAKNTKGCMVIKKVLNEHGVDTSKNMKRYSNKISDSCKKYKLDKTVFDKIDTQEKAYWLGFLFADGYNHETKQCVSLRLKNEDVEILEKFKLFLKTDSPIYTFKRKLNKTKIGIYSELNICSPYISKSLSLLGCIQNKTYLVEFPNIDESLYSHFIRGYFDGDGCISITNRKDRKSLSYQLNFTGKESFLSKIKSIICKNTNVFNTKIRHTNSFAVAISWNGRNVCKSILDWLYKDATIYLQRKYLKYMQLSIPAK